MVTLVDRCVISLFRYRGHSHPNLHCKGGASSSSTIRIVPDIYIPRADMNSLT